jgi:putative DNA primase/helicase
MNAQQIGIALKGRRNGNGWLVCCPCPNHGKGRGDRFPSLSVTDGDDDRLLLRCFAGCEFVDILGELKHRGLVGSRQSRPQSRPRLRHVPKPPEPDPIALEIWRATEPIHATIAEEYLQRRGILLTPPTLAHYRGAMVVAFQQPYHGITAIQKTPIKPDFNRGDRMTKGPLGNGAVRLGAAQEIMGIAEGIETALSAMMLTGMSVWASLGGKRLHNVELPAFVRDVHIFADNDQAGREAAYRASDVHRELGRSVKIRRPPPQFKDFNDFIVADADAWAKDWS